MSSNTNDFTNQRLETNQSNPVIADRVKIVAETGQIVLDIPSLIPPQAVQWGVSIAIPALFAVLWKYILQPRYDKITGSFNYSLSQEQQLNNLANRVLAKTDADRVLIYLPHNGTKYMNGLHQWKLSCKTEAVSGATSSIKRFAQNIDIGSVVETARYLQTNLSCQFTKDVVARDTFLTEFYATYGVSNAIIVGLKTSKPGQFCIIDLHYTHTNVDMLTELEKIKEECRAVSSVVGSAKPPFLQTIFKNNHNKA